MVEPGSRLLAFSDHAAELVERTAGSVVAVQGGGRWPSSGIHWRSEVIVTAEEVLERDENIKLTLPGGRVAEVVSRIFRTFDQATAAPVCASCW
jgi:serine protease Do